MLNEEDIALLEHRFTATTQSQLVSNLIGYMIDYIDVILTNSNKTDEISPTNCSLPNKINRLQILKRDIIHQRMLTSRKMAEFQ